MMSRDQATARAVTRIWTVQGMGHDQTISFDLVMSRDLEMGRDQAYERDLMMDHD